jgi:hypothetical protein
MAGPSASKSASRLALISQKVLFIVCFFFSLLLTQSSCSRYLSAGIRNDKETHGNISISLSRPESLKQNYIFYTPPVCNALKHRQWVFLLSADSACRVQLQIITTFVMPPFLGV